MFYQIQILIHTPYLMQLSAATMEKGRVAVKVLIKNLAIFFLFPSK
jgi:endonuclease IV